MNNPFILKEGEKVTYYFLLFLTFIVIKFACVLTENNGNVFVCVYFLSMTDCY